MNPLDLHCYITPSERQMYEEFVRPVAEQDFNLIPHFGPDEIWKVVLQKRALLSYETVKEAKKPIAWCDIDMLFLKPSADRLMELLKEHDFIAQSDGIGGICMGIVVYRPSLETIDFLNFVSHDQASYDNNCTCDQEAANKVIHLMRWASLPKNEFYSSCFAKGLRGYAHPGWLPTTEDFPVDARIIHANCVFGPEKMGVLNAYKDLHAALKKES